MFVGEGFEGVWGVHVVFVESWAGEVVGPGVVEFLVAGEGDLVVVEFGCADGVVVGVGFAGLGVALVEDEV